MPRLFRWDHKDTSNGVDNAVHRIQIPRYTTQRRRGGKSKQQALVVFRSLAFHRWRGHCPTSRVPVMPGDWNRESEYGGRKVAFLMSKREKRRKDR
jgi:hypothetical protein